MLFQTWDFVIFFLVVMAGLAVIRPKLKALWLLLASYYFYGSTNMALLVLILYITAVDYFIGRGLDRLGRDGWRRFLVAVSVVNGVALLSFFKYADFITENIQRLVDWLTVAGAAPWHVPTVVESSRMLCGAIGINYEFPERFLLPAGISFFTFKSLSYVIDVYRRRQRVERNFINYACFLAFFPALLSGPIDRAGLLLRQIKHKMVVRPVDVADGVSMFIVGLFKKVVLADTLGLFVDQVYNAPGGTYGAVPVLFATYAFAWQLYGDFSGYTDMARGVARVMGFHLTLNFNNPYVAVDITDFWRRWHISLSTWFRDYVYIPLGGNRAATWRIGFNLFITMVVSGFWHGSAWTFIIWGAWHGLACVVWRFFDKSNWYLKTPKLVKQLIVFNVAAFGWIFFRANTLGEAWGMVKTLFAPAEWLVSGLGSVPWAIMVPAGCVWLYQLVFDSRFGRVLAWAPVRYALMALVIILILTVPSDANQKFLYFDF